MKKSFTLLLMASLSLPALAQMNSKMSNAGPMNSGEMEREQSKSVPNGPSMADMKEEEGKGEMQEEQEYSGLEKKERDKKKEEEKKKMKDKKMEEESTEGVSTP